MGHSLEKCIFILILMKIGQLQSAPALGCGCSKGVLPPIPVAPPAPPPALPVPCPTHGYKVEIPAAPTLKGATLSYALDVVVEAPVPVAPPVACSPNMITPLPPPPPAPVPCALPPPPPAPVPCALPPPPPAAVPCALPPPPPAPVPCALPPPPPVPCALPPPPPAPVPCALPAPAPVLAPLPLTLPLSPALLALYPNLAALAGLSAPLPDDFSGVAPLLPPAPPKVTYELVSSALPVAPPAPLPAAYSLDLSPVAPPCGCAAVHKPPCRYVSKGTTSNNIFRERSKREVSSTIQQIYIDELRDYLKSLKTTRFARKAKKSKLVKRDIKGEYDLLQREQSEMDLTIPEIIQYMPETMMPNFKRGKCNIGCKNCIHNDLKGQFKRINSKLPTEMINNNENDQPTEQQQQQQPSKVLNVSTTDSPIQHFDMSPRSATGENYYYDKRSLNPFQSPNPNPSYSGLLPPPYISSTMELTKLAQNPAVNPIWYEPQPLTDPNSEYVYDRLGHKYKVKNGSFQLVKPDLMNDNDESVVDRSPAHVASVENAEDKTDEAKTFESSTEKAIDQQQLLNASEAKKLFDSAMIQQQAFSDSSAPPSSAALNDQKMIQTPVVGAPAHHPGPSYDPHMDKVIRDIVYQHPDFIEATQHAPGSLTLPEEVTRDETMQFLDKLIRGRFSKWFGSSSEQVSMSNLEDLNRFSQETGTTVKFIPIVTVDRDRLDMYRQKTSEATS